MRPNSIALASAWQEFHAGRLESAESAAVQFVAEQPNNADGPHLLGLIAYRRNRNSVALEYFDAAIRLAPSSSEYHNSKGEAQRALCNLEAAKAEYVTAISLEPRNASALNNLGLVHCIEGEYELGARCFEQAIHLVPSLSAAHENLGTVRLAQRLPEAAVAAFQRGLSLLPASTRIRVGLVGALRMQGRKIDAVQVLLDGLAANSGDKRLRLALVETLEGYPLANATQPVRELLEALCRDDGIATQSLAHAVTGLVKHAPAFGQLRNAVAAGADILAPTASGALLVDVLTKNSLLLAAMPRMVVNDPDLERIFTHLRRCLLMRLDLREGNPPGKDLVPLHFLSAFARQCFNTEYAYFQLDDESKLLVKLGRRIDSLLKRSSKPTPELESRLLHWVLYAPLHKLQHLERLEALPREQWSPAIHPILEDQVDARRKERDISSKIEAITPISNTISKAVRKQYEESPYPRWFGIHRFELGSSQNVESASISSPGNEPRRPFESALVAGCGTGQHPLTLARRYPACAILAIDLSRSSLSYAKRMAERLGISNVTFAQADILELSNIAKRFDHVECSGVLHHMKDPIAGWRVLAGLLQASGTMKIALYSEAARRAVVELRALITDRGLPATPEGVRKIRNIVLERSSEDSMQSILNSLDFYSLSGCRDLLMHVQEHRFTIPRIRQCIEEIGLRFVRFECSAELQGKFCAQYQASGALSDLGLWNQFESENPDSFRGMYQFTCEKLPLKMRTDKAMAQKTKSPTP